MITKNFNEDDWRFEISHKDGQLLAAVYDAGKADTLRSMYKKMEEQDKDLQQQTQQEQEMAEMGCRIEDNKGGE